MDVVAEIFAKTAKDAEKYKSIEVTKHLELEYDLGTLLALDNNDLDETLLKQSTDDYLKALTRDNVQLLMNQIWQLPTERNKEGDIVAKLRPPTFALPRSKRVPRPKALTRWEQYAKDKGIVKKKKSKLNWDEQLRKWVPLYGFKRAQAQKEKDWVLEVPHSADPFEDQFAKKSEAKTERVAKNELQRLRNIAKARNVKVPRTGLLTPDVSSAKDLEAAVTVSRASTASVGRFQRRLAGEKDAKGVAHITPGSRKRKAAPAPPASGEHERTQSLALVDAVLNKRPRIDIDKAVARHINDEQITRSEDKRSERPLAGRSGKKRAKASAGNARGSGSGKKPKAGAGGRKSMNNKGRKRR